MFHNLSARSETLDKRLEEQQRIKKQSWDEQRVDGVGPAGSGMRSAGHRGGLILHLQLSATCCSAINMFCSAINMYRSLRTCAPLQAEKRKRQAEAAARAQAAADEAQRALQRFQQQQQQGGGAGGAQADAAAAPAGGEPGSAAAAAPAGPAPMEVDGASAAAAGQGAAAAGPGGSTAENAVAAVAAATMAAVTGREGGWEDKETEAERHRQRSEQVRQEMEANGVRLEPLGFDRRHNRYWRLPGGGPGDAAAAAAAAVEGGEGDAHAAGAPPPPPPGDRVLFESADDGSLSLVSSAAALATLVEALERRGAREGSRYASRVRFRDQLEAGTPAALLVAPPPLAESEAAALPRGALLALPLAAPALHPQQLPGSSSEEEEEAAAAGAAAEEAAAADLAPLRKGDSLAVTRLKLVGVGGGIQRRCFAPETCTGVHASGCSPASWGEPAWPPAATAPGLSPAQPPPHLFALSCVLLPLVSSLPFHFLLSSLFSGHAALPARPAVWRPRQVAGARRLAARGAGRRLAAGAAPLAGRGAGLFGWMRGRCGEHCWCRTFKRASFTPVVTASQP